MPMPGPCLTPNELEAFLLGCTDDDAAESCEHHLQECPDCQQQMKLLGAEDELVQALRQPRAAKIDGVSEAVLEDVDVSPDLVNVLIPHFKKIANAFEETIEMAGSETHTGADLMQSTFSSSTSPATSGDFPTHLGRYEVRGILGRGGMGTVLHAFDPLLNRSIAVKVLQARWLAEDGMAERMVREAQAAAAVQHDHIVPIYSVELRNGNPCIVMPLLKGESLHQRLQTVDGPLPLNSFLKIARQVCEGLAAAHAAGLIHCDIKPANLWLEAPDDRVKILDFGLAVAHGDGSRETGSISGTPGYLAPEQARGEPVDQRSDLFSLGCVLYRMSTGQAPFSGEPRMRALWTVLSEPPLAASAINPDLPEVLSDLIDRLMSREPGDRPVSAAEVIAVLESYDRHLADLRAGLSRRKWLFGMVGVALLSGAGVGTWAIFTAPAPVKPVAVTFLGDEPAIDVILHRDGREWLFSLGSEAVLSIPPGDYTVRPVVASEVRRLVPDQFAITPQKAQLVRIASVGEIARHTQHTQSVNGLAVVPGSNPPVIFSVGADRALVRWEPAGSGPQTFVNLPYSAKCVAVSSLGDEVATAGGNRTLPPETAIELRRRETIEAPARLLEGHTRIVNFLAYSPDGMWLASCSAEGVLLWNRQSGASQWLPESDSQATATLAFSPDSQGLLGAGEEGRVSLWDVSSSAVIRTVIAGTDTVRAATFVPGGFLTAGDDGVVRLWSEALTPRELVHIDQPILTIAVTSKDAVLLTGDRGGQVRVWSLATGEPRDVLRGHSRAVQAVAFVGDGRQAVSAGADGTVRLWQLPFP